MSLRLGFHYHVPAARDADGAIVMPGYLGRFVESLAQYCEQVVCYQHLPSRGDLSELDHRIERPNVRLVPLGRYSSVPKRFVMGVRIVRPIRQSAGEIDVLLVRGPSPLLPAAVGAAQPRARTALLLVGDFLKGVAELPQPWWRKELIRLWSKWNKRGQDRAAASSLTFVNSEVLLEEYRERALKVVMTRTTTLRAQDIWLRDRISPRGPLRVLYVGRVDTGKGILDIAEAIRLLVGSGHDVVFDLVGSAETGDPVLRDLRRFTRLHGLSDRIQQHGYKPLGSELFQFFREADVFVVASRGSEGFPRTIWEAMANGTPVVATRVGSIPKTLRHQENALLVEPNSPQEIANAISFLSDDPRIRTRLVESGYELARASTLEQLTPRMISQLEAFASV